MNATKQSHPEGCSAGGIVISQGAFTAFLFWVCEILQDSDTPKQALINAFYNMSAKQLIVNIFYQPLCDCKITTIF